MKDRDKLPKSESPVCGRSLKELAALTKAELAGDASHLIEGVEALEAATASDASFLANPRYLEAMKKSQAGVICVDSKTPRTEGKNYLISDNPSRAFQTIAEVFLTSDRNSGFEGIHPSAIIHPSTQIAPGVRIGPYAVIDKGVTIAKGCSIGPHVSIGAGVTIGTDCILHPHVTIREGCIIGNRVILQPGAVIGSCGFGYLPDDQGNYVKLEQIGIVVIEDDVEVGANTTIDRARFKETRIGKGTKIDNLVQIGHNVSLGAHNIIVSQTGIAGSVKTGKYLITAGQVGIVGHLEITDNVIIASRGGVSKSIDKPGRYAGGPVLPLAEHNKQQVYLRKLSSHIEKLKELEKKIEELEKK